MHYRKSLEARPTYLLYANKTPKDILFKDELERYTSKFGNLKVHYYVEVRRYNCTSKSTTFT